MDGGGVPHSEMARGSMADAAIEAMPTTAKTTKDLNAMIKIQQDEGCFLI